MKQAIAIASIMLLSGVAFSDDTVSNTITQNTVDSNSIVGTATDWNLTDVEWKKYISLMQGIYGKYYAHLTPPEVLGNSADNDEDRRHYAEVAVQLEHEKISRELAFNREYTQAAERLYPNEPLIKSFDFTPYTPIPNAK